MNSLLLFTSLWLAFELLSLALFYALGGLE